MIRFGRNRRTSINRIKAWTASLTSNWKSSLEDWQRLRDWKEAVRSAQDGLEKLGFEGFVDLGQGILFHPATGQLYLETSTKRAEIEPHLAFGYYGGCQPTIDALANALEELTHDLEPDISHA